ncbi:putative tryptophan--tRNA ligase [Helianthus anomalus]
MFKSPNVFLQHHNPLVSYPKTELSETVSSSTNKKMGRSLLSHFLNLSNACPRFTSYGTSSKLQRTLPMIHQNHLPLVGVNSNHRCYCSVSAPEPTVSESSSTSIKKRIVSGVQPTGSIHLGNYLGAIKNWVSLQDTCETLFFIVDLHAITLPYDVQQLSKATRDTAALYLACGVDTSKVFLCHNFSTTFICYIGFCVCAISCGC